MPLIGCGCAGAGNVQDQLRSLQLKSTATRWLAHDVASALDRLDSQRLGQGYRVVRACQLAIVAHPALFCAR